jgi:hypothetical protein
MKTLLVLTALSLALAGATAVTQAQPRGGLSDLSAMSILPVAVSVVAPVALLSAGAVLTVVAVEASSAGTVWVLERASDGARASVTLSGAALAGASMLVGGVVMLTAFSAGVVLSAAGKALCYVPNEIGKSLLHNERVTR